MIGRAQTGIETAIAADLSFEGAIGVSVQNTSQETNAFATGPADSETNVDGLFNAQLTWLPRPSTQVLLSASHWTGPNVLGQVESRTVFSAAFGQAINPLSNIWLRTDYTGQIPMVNLFDDGDTNYVRAAIDYDYRFCPDWIAQVSYRFAHSNDDDESASSNTLFLSAIYETTILP